MGEPVGHAPGDDATDHSEIGEMDLRVRALESVLVDKGYVDPAALDALIETYETRIGPRNGARVVARAWLDPEFRDWLLRDATAAIASLDYHGLQGEHMMAVANTKQRHNLVVCTLCSCYPWPVLGLPPTWYKSAPYRGLDGRSALPGGADAAGRQPRPRRRRACRARNTRFDDRHRPSARPAGSDACPLSTSRTPISAANLDMDPSIPTVSRIPGTLNGSDARSR
jgi:nitrile hydratase